MVKSTQVTHKKIMAVFSKSHYTICHIPSKPMRSLLVYSLVTKNRKLGIKLQLNHQAKGQLSTGMFVASNSQMESLKSICVLVPKKCCFRKHMATPPPFYYHLHVSPGLCQHPMLEINK